LNRLADQVSACSKVKRLAAHHANTRRIRLHPVANQPAHLIRRRPVSLLTSIQPPKIRRTVRRQLSRLIQRRRTIMSRRLRSRKETILRLLREHILQGKVSMTVRAMTVDLVAAAAAAVTAEVIAVAGSVVEADAIAVDVRRDEICPHRNTHRQVRRARHIHRIHLRDHSPREIVRTISHRRRIIFRQLFCRVNRLRNIKSGRQ
jgi:hypothetical protein